MPSERPNTIRNKIIAGVSAGAIATALIAAIVLYELNKNSQASTASTAMTEPAQTTTQVSTPTSTDSSSSASSGYKDGTYSASSDYYVPGGQESIKVTLTLKNGVVTDSNVDNSENDQESARYQEEFASEYKSQVVGKNIAAISISYVAGASDTTQGFDDALSQIMSQAKA